MIVVNPRLASYRNNIPPSKPLLRTVVARPNAMPEASVIQSPLLALSNQYAKRPSAYRQNPEKLRKEKRLSAYGAVKKRPAGEMI